MTPSLLLLLTLAAFAAGFVDAVVGGGGLISVPALLLGLPAAPLPVILGINKVQSFTGTTFAAGKFVRSGALHIGARPRNPPGGAGAPAEGGKEGEGGRGGPTLTEPDDASRQPPPPPEGLAGKGPLAMSSRLNDEPHRPAPLSVPSSPCPPTPRARGYVDGLLGELVAPVVAAMVGASGGVALAYRVKGDFLRPLLLGLLVIMLAWTLLKPDLGEVHAPRYGLAHQRGLAVLIALGIGFYDGFFGPGTGSLLIFLFVAVLGFDFLRASALAKSVNWASNAASVALFVSRGSWLPGVAAAMAVGNGLGGYLGAHLALEKGARFVRGFFLAVVSALILRLGWQMFQP